jgi:hypothetical protein
MAFAALIAIRFSYSCFYDRGCSAKMDIGSKFPWHRFSLNGDNLSVYYKTESLPFASL